MSNRGDIALLPKNEEEERSYEKFVQRFEYFLPPATVDPFWQRKQRRFKGGYSFAMSQDLVAYLLEFLRFDRTFKQHVPVGEGKDLTDLENSLARKASVLVSDAAWGHAGNRPREQLWRLFLFFLDMTHAAKGDFVVGPDKRDLPSLPEGQERRVRPRTVEDSEAAVEKVVTILKEQGIQHFTVGLLRRLASVSRAFGELVQPLLKEAFKHMVIRPLQEMLEKKEIFLGFATESTSERWSHVRRLLLYISLRATTEEDLLPRYADKEVPGTKLWSIYVYSVWHSMKKVLEELEAPTLVYFCVGTWANDNVTIMVKWLPEQRMLDFSEAIVPSSLQEGEELQRQIGLYTLKPSLASLEALITTMLGEYPLLTLSAKENGARVVSSAIFDGVVSVPPHSQVFWSDNPEDTLVEEHALSIIHNLASREDGRREEEEGWIREAMEREWTEPLPYESRATEWITIYLPGDVAPVRGGSAADNERRRRLQERRNAVTLPHHSASDSDAEDIGDGAPAQVEGRDTSSDKMQVDDNEEEALLATYNPGHHFFFL